MIILRVHGLRVTDSPRSYGLPACWADLPSHWGDSRVAGVEKALPQEHWLFGATRRQFRQWWPRCEIYRADEKGLKISLISVPLSHASLMEHQVTFNPDVAKVIATLEVEAAIYLTRKYRRTSRPYHNLIRRHINWS